MRPVPLFAFLVALAVVVGGPHAKFDAPATPLPGEPTDADPVHLSSGVYTRHTTDFVIQDVLPIWFRRVYLSSDTRRLTFGVGTTHSYDYYLTGDLSAITVILDDRGRIPYRRIDGGTEREGSRFEHWTTPSRFFGSALEWVGDQWGIGLADGSGLFFRSCGTRASPNGRCTLIGVQDAAGNHLTLLRDEQGRLVKVETPNRRWLRLEYDSVGRITRGWASTGRQLHYEYDGHGRLRRVMDQEGRIRTYDYDERGLLRRMDDWMGAIVENEYDADGRTVRQVITYAPNVPENAPAPVDVFEFRYVVAGERVTDAEVLRPGGVRRRLRFNTNGYPTSEVWSFPDGRSHAITYARDPATNTASSIQIACAGSDGLVTQLAARVAPRERADRVARVLSAQCDVPYLSDDDTR